MRKARRKSPKCLRLTCRRQLSAQIAGITPITGTRPNKPQTNTRSDLLMASISFTVLKRVDWGVSWEAGDRDGHAAERIAEDLAVWLHHADAGWEAIGA
mgnify:CR=1 FL=1